MKLWKLKKGRKGRLSRISQWGIATQSLLCGLFLFFFSFIYCNLDTSLLHNTYTSIHTTTDIMFTITAALFTLLLGARPLAASASILPNHSPYSSPTMHLLFSPSAFLALSHMQFQYICKKNSPTLIRTPPSHACMPLNRSRTKNAGVNQKKNSKTPAIMMLPRQYFHEFMMHAYVLLSMKTYIKLRKPFFL